MKKKKKKKSHKTVTHIDEAWHAKMKYNAKNVIFSGILLPNGTTNT